jgi:hypothetical protein
MKIRITIEQLGSETTPLYRDFYINKEDGDYSNISNAVDDMIRVVSSEYNGEFDRGADKIDVQKVINTIDEDIKEIFNRPEEKAKAKSGIIEVIKSMDEPLRSAAVKAYNYNHPDETIS